MPSQAGSAVTYVGLPIASGGGHSLRGLTLTQAHQAMLDFLAACAEQTQATTYGFSVLDIPTIPVIPSDVARLKSRFASMTVPPEQALDAVAFLEEIQPPPSDRGVGPIWLNAQTGFRLLDPGSGAPLAGQDPERFGGKEFDYLAPLGTSRMKLSLHHSASLALDISIPDVDDEELSLVAGWLQEHLPFKFSPKQWKRWTPTKTGSFVGRKIPPPRT